MAAVDPAQPKLYDISVGKYDVTVRQGPNFASQREETRKALIEIIQALPAAAPVLGDALMEHMDFVGAGKIAERLRMMLPPEMRQAEEAEGMDDLPPEARSALMGAQQTIQQLQQALRQATEAANQVQADAADKQAGHQIDMQTATAEHIRETQELQATTALKNRELAIKEREVAVKEAEAEIKFAEARQVAQQSAVEAETREQTESALQAAAASMQALAQVLGAEAMKADQRHNELLLAVTAPKDIQIERDQSGRLSGGRTEIVLNS